MLPNEKIGEAGEDACEVALNYLRLEGFILGYKRFTNREGREDFEVMFSDGTIYNIEQKNHKAGSYWTRGQAAKYAEQIKGSGVKVLLKTDSTFKPGARQAISNLGIKILKYGQQILSVSAKAVSNVLTALLSLIQPRSGTKSNVGVVSSYVGVVGWFRVLCSVVCSLFRGFVSNFVLRVRGVGFCTIVQASNKLECG